MVFVISAAKCRSFFATSHQVLVILKMASFFDPVYISLSGFLYKFLSFWVFWFCLVSVCVFASETKSCRLVGSRLCVNGFMTPSLINAMSSSLFSPGSLLNTLSSLSLSFSESCLDMHVCCDWSQVMSNGFGCYL